MKKLSLFAAVAVSLLVASVANAQSDSTTTTGKTTRTKHTAKRTTTITTRDNNAAVNRRLRRIDARSGTITTAVPQGSRVDGGVVRAVRSRNPLQMINPFAPKEYGSGNDVAFHEPDDAFQRPEGLRLYEVTF